MGLLDVIAQLTDKVVSDEGTAKGVERLSQLLGRSRTAFDGWQRRSLQTLGVVSRDELREAAQRLSRLRRTARALDEKISLLDERLRSTK